MEYTIGRFIKFLISVFVLIALGWLIVTLSSTITILIISALIAYILDPVATYFEYRGLSRTKATIVIFLIIAAFFAGAISFLIPPIANELSHISNTINSGESSRFFEKIENMVQTNIPFIEKESLDIQGTITNLVEQLSSSLFLIIGSVVSIITTLIIIPFTVFFILKDGRDLNKSFVGLIPNRYFEMVLNIIHKIDLQLGGYLRGQFFDALIIGFLSTIALWILNVPYFMLIGIFAGLANMIPYIGPLAGGVTAVSVVLVNGGSGQQVLLVVIAFLIVQLTDNVLVQPLVVAKTVNLHPLIIVFAVIIGGQFFGVLGMLLAVPAAGIIKVLTSEFYLGFKKYRYF